MELEESSTPFDPPHDTRPRLEEPIPVNLIAVNDVTLLATAGMEHELDAFYASMLLFQRNLGEEGIVYQADNFKLRFQLVEGLIERDNYRPVVIEVPSLADTERKLNDRELEYRKERGLFVGQYSLVLFDPAGNYVELVEHQPVP